MRDRWRFWEAVVMLRTLLLPTLPSLLPRRFLALPALVSVLLLRASLLQLCIIQPCQRELRSRLLLLMQTRSAAA